MPEHDELDRLLDSALATYADPGPGSGLEERVLAALAQHSLPVSRPRRRRIPWLIAIPVAACVVGVWLAIPKSVHPPVSGPQIAERHQPANAIPFASHPAQPQRKSAHRSRSFDRPAPALIARAVPAPKLDVFPAPRPLTAEEQVLVSAVTGGSKAEREALLESQKPLDSPLDIAALNIPPLAALARQGYAILTAIPSCTLMFKQELPLMFPQDADVQAVREAMFDPFEYLVARNKDGLLDKGFKQPLGKVSYHVPCHARVQNVGRKTEELLQQIPGTEVTTVERCSGHSGTWGVKKEFHPLAMKIGRPVFRAMAEPAPDYISSDCQLAGHHIEQGMREAGAKPAQLAHPITLLRRAYGL